MCSQTGQQATVAAATASSANSFDQLYESFGMEFA